MKELDCGMLGLAGMPVGSAMQGKWRGGGTYWDIHLSKIRLIRTLGQPEPCKGQQNKVSNRNNIIYTTCKSLCNCPSTFQSSHVCVAYM